MNPQEGAFFGGVIYGVIVAGVLGFIWNQIRAARIESGKMYRTLDTWSDAQQPNLTPAGIVRKSMLSRLGCIFWFLMFFLAAYGLQKFYIFLANQIR